MSLFAIADTHLSLSADKPMDIFNGWSDYVQRLEKNWRAVVSDGDTVVIPGDVSWAMSLEGAQKDFAFLDSLPGKKILMKGNHDYWWNTARKMENFFKEKGFETLSIVHNSAVSAISPSAALAAGSSTQRRTRTKKFFCARRDGSAHR